MPRRVDPELYHDTPVFRGLLRDRKGRFPGTPEGEMDLPEIPLWVTDMPTLAPEDAPTVIQAAYRVQPLPGLPNALLGLPEDLSPILDRDPPERARPYAKEFLAQDPQETQPMMLPPLPEDHPSAL
jgi:hypothetical protein